MTKTDVLVAIVQVAPWLWIAFVVTTIIRGVYLRLDGMPFSSREQLKTSAILVAITVVLVIVWWFWSLPDAR